MPNLSHDPKNPSDLLGRPIKAGDVVVWATQFGRSPAIAVCVIDRIRFTRPSTGGNWRVVNEECEQWQAEDYQLYMHQIKSTSYSGQADTDFNGHWKISPDARPNRVQLVKNVVKLEDWDGILV